MTSILLRFQNMIQRKTPKKLQISERDLAQFSAPEGFPLCSTCFRPSTKKLSTRVLRASARARTSQIDPGRDGELARRVSHDVAAWSPKPRHRATRERRGVHAIEFQIARVDGRSWRFTATRAHDWRARGCRSVRKHPHAQFSVLC